MGCTFNMTHPNLHLFYIGLGVEGQMGLTFNMTNPSFTSILYRVRGRGTDGTHVQHD
jgi:hypothetical protein